jgi:hypothetical protein
MLRQRQPLHGRASRPDPNRPFTRIEPTPSVFPLEAQQPATARLQVDPD